MFVARYIYLLFFCCFFIPKTSPAQNSELSLSACFEMAAENNGIVEQMEQSLTTRRFHYEASRHNFLPDVDLLAGYHYLGEPIRVNLQTVRQGIVEGSAQQSVNTANEIFQKITGNTLPQNAQDALYQSSKNIIGGIYPDYNPALSEQSYFTSAVALRQPLYLGGKLNAARKVAKEQWQTGQLNLKITQNTIDYAVASQYLQILYLNSMLAKQEQLVEISIKINAYADAMVKSELIPPYQKNWAEVILAQAQTSLNHFRLEKQNAILTLKHLLGTDKKITISDTLNLASSPLLLPPTNFITENPEYQWLESKTEVAEMSVKVAKSLSLPNIFGFASYQFLREDLPVITPPWMIGVEMHWNIFSFFENTKRVKAAKSLVEESELLTQNKKRNLQLELNIVQNKLKTIRNEVKTLNKVRTTASLTTEMVRKRMQNEFSSVKDVNDALLLQLETEKAYYMAVLAYNIAVATYLKIQGKPRAIINHLK